MWHVHVGGISSIMGQDLVDAIVQYRRPMYAYPPGERG